MDNKSFNKTVIYGSIGLVAVVAAVFSGERLLPNQSVRPAGQLQAQASTGHSNPWSIDRPAPQSTASSSLARPPQPTREVYEPEDSYGAPAPLDTSGPVPGEPNHSNQLPTGGTIGTAPQPPSGGGSGDDGAPETLPDQ